MKINIRKAKKEDMQSVLNLIVELAVFEMEPDAVKISVADLEKNGFGEEPMFICFVAEVENNIVGMALVYYRFSTWNGRIVHLEDLVVKDSWRGKGVGGLLYAEVMKYANTNNATRVQWEVIDWNEGAIKFYERSGAKVYKNWHVVKMDDNGLKRFIEKL